jgi:hypothetical protein
VNSHIKISGIKKCIFYEKNTKITDDSLLDIQLMKDVTNLLATHCGENACKTRRDKRFTDDSMKMVDFNCA